MRDDHTRNDEQNQRPPSVPTGDWAEHRMTQWLLDELIAAMPHHRECRCSSCGASFQQHSYDRISDEGLCPECFEGLHNRQS